MKMKPLCIFLYIDTSFIEQILHIKLHIGSWKDKSDVKNANAQCFGKISLTLDCMETTIRHIVFSCHA